MNHTLLYKRLERIRIANDIKKQRFPSRKDCMNTFGFVPYGFADCYKKLIAINPEAQGPDRTMVLLHELAHILMGHKHPPYDGVDFYIQELEVELAVKKVFIHCGIRWTQEKCINSHRYYLRKLRKNSKMKPDIKKVNLFVKYIKECL